MHFRTVYTGFVAAVLLTACRGHDVTSLDALSAGGSYAKAPPQADTRPAANYVIADSVFAVGPSGEAAIWRGAGIRGDARMKNGLLRPVGYAASEYQHAWCGSGAFFYSDDFDSSPTASWIAKYQRQCAGPARGYRYFLAGSDDPTPWTGGSGHSVARALYSLAPGASALQWQGFGVSLTTSCGRLMFDDAFPPSNSPIQQRLPDSVRTDGVVVRRWTISSRGSHYAVCGVMEANGVFVPDGMSYYLPFAITVTEVPYPFPKYP